VRHDAGMANPRGNVDALVPAPRGNLRGLRHGAYSKRALAPRAAEVAEAPLELPWAQPLDRLAAEEVGSVIAALEAIDQALADGRVENKRGQVRHLLAMKATLSRTLKEWLTVLGATPAARAEWATKLTRPTFAELVEAKRQQIEAEQNGHE
jgi:hypothetical protein